MKKFTEISLKPLETMKKLYRNCQMISQAVRDIAEDAKRPECTIIVGWRRHGDAYVANKEHPGVRSRERL